jgi:hypothetical protein
VVVDVRLAGVLACEILVRQVRVRHRRVVVLVAVPGREVLEPLMLLVPVVRNVPVLVFVHQRLMIVGLHPGKIVFRGHPGLLETSFPYFAPRRGRQDSASSAFFTRLSLVGAVCLKNIAAGPLLAASDGLLTAAAPAYPSFRALHDASRSDGRRSAAGSQTSSPCTPLAPSSPWLRRQTGQVRVPRLLGMFGMFAAGRTVN